MDCVIIPKTPIDEKIALLRDFQILRTTDNNIEWALRYLLKQCEVESQMTILLHDVLRADNPKKALGELLNSRGGINKLCKTYTKEVYIQLKEMAGKAELVTEDAIRGEFGDKAFHQLRREGFIEHCRVDGNGQHWYAI